MTKAKFDVNDRVKVIGGRKEYQGKTGKITSRETRWDSFNKPRYDYFVKFAKSTNGSYFLSYQLKHSV